MLTKEVRLKSGDIGLSKGSNWVSKLIIWAQDTWTEEARWSHVFASIGREELVEALSKIRLTSLERYNNKDVEVFRLPLTAKERIDFREGMILRINGSYGFLKYPLFFLDASTSWLKRRIGMKKPCFFFTRVFGISNLPVCSQLVVWGIHKYTSYRFKNAEGKVVNWRVVTPDYLEDLIKLKVNESEKIFSS